MNEPEIVTDKCDECGCERRYQKHSGPRREFCRLCSIVIYNARRGKLSREETARRQAEWQRRNSDKLAVRYSEYREKIRLLMVDAYGGKCARCGVTDPIVLTIDHINDDGIDWRKANKNLSGYPFYVRLRKLGWPKDGLQLLCHNCNFRKEYAKRKRDVAKRRGAVSTILNAEAG